MRIDSAISHVPAGQQVRQAKADEKLIKDQQKVVEQQEIELPEEEQSDCQGVLRLLQEGHFKGVADVRLRINFHEEIAALEQQNINEQASQAANELKIELSTASRNIITAADLPQEQTGEAIAIVDDFETTVDESLSHFQSEPGSTLDQLIADIQNAYDNFVGRLNEILNPAPVETAGDTEGGEPTIEMMGLAEEPVLELTNEFEQEPLADDLIGAPPVVEEISELEPPVVELPLWQTELNSIFSAAMERFTSINNSTSSLLPPISESSGNGNAFEKFMAIYNELQNPTTVDVLENPEHLVDFS